ncbi:putative phage tail protein [Clostridium tetani]|uniref:putative phage tail protein n=1 Tax=Clostridium tetani TaxID=1513 RepID=UPI001678C186|nr:putative phage tail protein [Clostridium tetani]
MYKYLPPFLLKNRDLKELIRVEQLEFNSVDELIEDIYKQCFIKTSTWGLKYWEKDLGIKSDKNKNYEERRSNILAKIRSKGTTTKKMLEEVALAYVDKATVTEDNPNYVFHINLESFRGYSFSLDNLYKYINEIKPAHLEAKYSLKSTTKDKIKIASILRAAETITVYPYNPKEIKLKGQIKLGLGDNTGLENITVYPKQKVR